MTTFGKKMKAALAALMAALALVLAGALAGCGEEALCHIVFMNGGAQYAVEEQVQGENVMFPEPPQKASDGAYSYEFYGWSLSEGPAVLYGDETTETVSEYVASGNVTFYAVYRAVEHAQTAVYTVTFRDGVTGLDIGEPQHVPLGGDAQPPEAPVHEGYTFTGWDKSYTNITSRSVITAQYSANDYTLVRHFLGEEARASIQFGSAIETEAPVTTPSAVRFTGWYFDEGCQEPVGEATMPANELHIYAGYELDLDPVYLSVTGDGTYGGGDDLVHVMGLSHAEGLAYSFEWTNAEGGELGLVKRAGETEVTLCVTANYKGVLSGHKTLKQTVNLGKAALGVQVRLESASGVYGSAPVPTAAWEGLQYGDAAPAVRFVFTDAEGHPAQGRLSAGEYTVSVEADGWDNYTLEESETAHYTVTPAPLTVSARVDGDPVYGSAPVPVVHYEGLVDEADAAAFSPVFEIKNAAQAVVEEKFPAGNYTVAVVGGEFGENYSAKFAADSPFAIGKKALTVGLQFGEETHFEYGSFEAPAAVGDGFVYGEDLSVLGGSAKLAYTAKGAPYTASRFHVGEYTVSVSGFTSANYAIEYAPAIMFTVVPKSLTTRVTASDVRYGTQPAPVLSFEGFVEGEGKDDLHLEGGELVYSKDGDLFEGGKFTVGSYTVKSGNFTSADYTIAPAEASFSVTRAPLTVTVKVGKPSYVYGEQPAASLTFGGFVYEETEAVLPQELLAVVWNREGGEAEGFHKGAYTATVALGETENYTVTVSEGHCTVTARPLTLTVKTDKTDYIYGEEVVLSYEAKGYAAGEGENDVFAQKPAFRYTKDSGDYTPSELLDAGSYTVDLVYESENADYTIEKTAAVFSVAKRTVAIALTATHSRDAAAWTFTPTLNDGRFRFEGKLTLTGTDARTYTATGNDLGGDFAWEDGWKIVLADGGKDVSLNFELSFALSITLSGSGFSITIPSEEIVYDGDAHVFAVTAEAHDEVEVTVEYSETGSGDWSAEKPSYTDAGERTVYYKVSAPNYETETGSFTVKIAKADYTVQTDAASYTYDGAEHGEKPTVKGVKGEDLSAYLSDTVYSFTAAGGHTVNYTVGGNDNYNDKQGSYTVHIAKADFTVSAAENIFTYNGAPQGEGVSVTVVHEGDAYTVTYESGEEAPAFTAAGEHTVHYTVGGNDNYNEKKGSYTVHIAKADFTVSAAENAFTYNGQAQGEGVTVTPVHDGDPYTVTYGENGKEVPTFTAAGEHTVHYTVGGNDNYNEKQGSYTVHIAKAQLTVSIGDVNTVYDGGNHFKAVERGDVQGLFGNDAFTVKYGRAQDAVTENSLTFVNVSESGKVYFKLEAENYEAAEGSYTVTIERAPRTIDTTGVQKQYTYSGAQQMVVLEGKVHYDGEGDGDFSYDTNTFKDVPAGGKFTIGLRVENGANYLDASVTIEITVLKKEFTIENVVAEADYTSPETVTYAYALVGVTEEDLAAVKEKVTIALTQAAPAVGGTYLVDASFSVGELGNYAFADGGTHMIVFKLKSVSVNGTLYTPEDALYTAQTGDVVVKANTSFAAADVAEAAGYTQADGYYTVKSGVTLFLPYNTEKDGERGIGQNGSKENTPGLNGTIHVAADNRFAAGNSDLCDLTVKLPAGVELINEGKIDIGGITTGGNGGSLGAGQTASGYARLIMGENSKISSSGEINVYGFIEEELTGNGAQVILESGTLRMPFVVIEHRGGSVCSGMAGGAVAAVLGTGEWISAPFNRYYMENVQPKLTIQYGAELLGHANLYASNQDNTTDIKLVGKTTSHMIQLSENSYVVAKYDHAKKVNTVNTYGSWELNSLSLTVSGAKLSMNKTFFPLSYHWDITLNANGGAATIDASKQDLKLYPGAQLTIGENVTVDAKQIALYDENYADPSTKDPKLNYPAGKGAAVLTVNGVLTATAIGGGVTAGKDGATVKANSASVKTSELLSSTGSGFSAKATGTDFTLQFKGTVAGEFVALEANKTYTAKDGGWQAEA